MPNEQKIWLHRTYYQETLKLFTSIWDIYIKFYTVFLTANIVGLGLAVQHIHFGNRRAIVVAFVIQNLLTFGTSIGVAEYCARANRDLSEIAEFLIASDPGEAQVGKIIRGSPIPVWLGRVAGYANGVGVLTLAGCWIFVDSLKDAVSATAK